MDRGFTQGDATPEKRSLAVWADTDRRKESARHDGPVKSHPLVPGIEDEVGNFAQRTVSPSVEVLGELGGGAADLRRGDLKATEHLHDLRGLPRTDPRDVNLGDGDGDRPLAADAAFECPEVEGAALVVTEASGLGNPQIDLADAGLEGRRLESVWVALTIGRSMTRLVVGGLLRLDLHGMILERGEDFGSRRRLQIDQHCIEIGEPRSDSFLVGHRRVSFLGELALPRKPLIAHLFNSRPRLGLPSARFARLGQAPTGFTERMMH